jgi:RNA recognition motif-containing protein
MKRRLFVDNIPKNATQSAIEALFSKAGKVEKVILVENKRDGRQEDHCFVQMATLEDAKKAIQLINRSKFENQILTVTHAGPVNQREGFSGVGTTEERKNR